MPPTDPVSFEALKVLVGAFGGSGVAFFVAWVVFRGWKEALSQKDGVLMQRIEALERATTECAKDRTALHAQMFELQKTTLTANTEILHKVLHQLKPGNWDDESKGDHHS
jgi:hypothetical protein